MSDEKNIHTKDVTGDTVSIGGTQNIYYSGSPPGGQHPNTTGGKPRVFVSYSRQDGETFAKKLRIDLEAEGLTLWQDRASMEGGVGWWQQITNALEQVEFMVLVATPAAMTSNTVRKEWRYARQQGVCVYPVFGQKETGIYYQMQDINTNEHPLPKWMRDSHFYDLKHEWETLVKYLKNPCTDLKVPFMADALPEYFVQRPEKFDVLKAQLLGANFENPVAITTALKGAGGFGKTTLAIALCHDEDVQTNFYDGVLWVTLGENPNIIDKLAVLYEALTGENNNFIDIEQGATKLAEKLLDADVLLVVDDVWDPSHLRPFLRGGERIARLVTTRFSNIAVDANAELLKVDEMTADESVALLTAGIDFVSLELRQTLFDLAIRLGEWALMLELTNAMLREELAAGSPLDDALSFVIELLDEEGVFGIEGETSNERKQSAEGVLAASLRRLKDKEITRLCELSIFVEDTDVPTTSVEVMWGMKSVNTRKLLTRLGRGSLITFDRERGVIRLHDVVREVLASRLDDTAVVHARLVDNYGDLTALPDDYAWRNIIHHLLEAKKEHKAYKLMRTPKYLTKKLDFTNPDALSNDCLLFSQHGHGDYSQQFFINIIRSFWLISRHILMKDENKHLLYSQLLGRLGLQASQHTEVALFLEKVQKEITVSKHVMLIPEEPTLKPAGGMLEKILTGHEGRVEYAQLLNQDYIASSDSNSDLYLWSSDGDLISKLSKHNKTIIGIIPVKKSRGDFLSWGQDNTIHLWKIDGKLVDSLEEHNSTILEVLELDNGFILSWSKDDAIRVWNLNARSELINVFKNPQSIKDKDAPNSLQGIIYLKDRGSKILTWNHDTIYIWDFNTGIFTEFCDDNEIISGVVELNNRRLISWNEIGELKLWSADGELLSIGEQRATQSQNSTLGRIRSTITKEPNTASQLNKRNLFQGHLDDIAGVKIIDDDVLIWGWDGSIQFWSEAEEMLDTVHIHNGPIDQIIHLSDNRFLSWTIADISTDQEAYIWSRNGQKSATLYDDFQRYQQNEEIGQISEIVPISESKFVIWSTDNNVMYMWTPNESLKYIPPEHLGSITGVIRLSDDQFISWSRDTNLLMWSTKYETVMRTRPHGSKVDAVLALHNDRVLTWSHEEPSQKLWSSNGQELQSKGTLNLAKHKAVVLGVFMLADERFLSWDEHGYLFFWSSEGELEVKFDVKEQIPIDDTKDTNTINLTTFEVRQLRNNHLMYWTHWVYENENKDEDEEEQLEENRLFIMSLSDYSLFYSNTAEASALTTVVDWRDWLLRQEYNPKIDLIVRLLNEEIARRDEVFRLRIEGKQLVVYLEDRRELLFIADNELTSFVQASSGNLILGDSAGNVHFLRPNQTLRRLMGLPDEPAVTSTGS